MVTYIHVDKTDTKKNYLKAKIQLIQRDAEYFYSDLANGRITTTNFSRIDSYSSDFLEAFLNATSATVAKSQIVDLLNGTKELAEAFDSSYDVRNAARVFYNNMSDVLETMNRLNGRLVEAQRSYRDVKNIYTQKVVATYSYKFTPYKITAENGSIFPLQ